MENLLRCNMQYTPENITSLEPNQVFVFGSNLAGRHIGGAAKIAKDLFGAIEGVGEGMTGRCYAFPTLGEDMKQRNVKRILVSVQKLFDCARANPDKIFLLTRVGCGIAGYTDEYMSRLFHSKDRPKNIVMPKGW